ncbi:hypothetical protein HCDG_08066 [Histoplasma capsulatum H143]|uniref:Uncharacterized protein n=1 Tax=Ajellomyces capsulatus (strain H143) TaxID=544712 RepID=C6HPD5_AJECH|nr:hypothetical protein HCDG_08066 [Histoplasma capsulatum H143]
MAPAKTPERRSHIISRASPAAGIGSVSRTPRFIFGSTAPSSAASQFAATPRFHFTERGGHVSDVETDIGDAVPPSSALADVGMQTGDSPCMYSREDEIQDSNSDEEEILVYDDSSSSPLGGYTETQNDEGGFDVDAEIDSIFPPTPEGRKAKRRRVSSPALDNPNADTISSCPSHPSASPSSPQPHSPVSSIASPNTPFLVDIRRQASSDVYTSGHPAPVTLIISTSISNASTASASGTVSTSAHRTVPSAIRQEPPSRKILVFGDPISTPSRTQNRSISGTPGQHPHRSASSFQPTHTLSKGDRIGIRRGLVWEMEIEAFGSNRPTREGREGVDCFVHAAGSTGETRGQDVRVEKWVVGVEWDIL